MCEFVLVRKIGYVLVMMLVVVCGSGVMLGVLDVCSVLCRMLKFEFLMLCSLKFVLFDMSV